MPNDPLVTKHNQTGGQTNYNNSFGNLGNISTGINVRSYSNTHDYGGAGTGSFDFSSMNELSGSGGGGGYDDSLELDSGIPLTKRNPMLRKNVTGYHSGGRVNPYKYNDGGWVGYDAAWKQQDALEQKQREKDQAYRDYIHGNPRQWANHPQPSPGINRSVKSRYAQGGVTPQQEANDGAMWANMAARLGQKNADIALLQTQKIIQGNGKGNPYQMPDQSTRFNNGGQIDWKDPNINMDNLVSDAYQDMFPNRISFTPRNRTNEMANQMSQSMKANQGMKRRYTQGGRF
jgi:hypothetical protein